MPDPRPPLSAVMLWALGLNGIVGVGIFIAPPLVASAVPGGRGALLFALVALACTPIALVYARLARAMPVDGGPCLYATHAFGPAVGRGIGVLVWVGAVFSTAAVTRGLADLVASRLSGGAPSTFAAPLLAFALTGALAAVNLRGVRISALAWTALTAAKLAPLAVLAILGVVSTGGGGAVAANGGQTDALGHGIRGALEAVETHGRVAPHAMASVGSALLPILFSLQGFEIVPLPAGEARDAARSVPRATVGALLAAGLLYAAVHFACVRALPDLATELAPIPAASGALGGPMLRAGVEWGVLASMAGIVVGMHAMTPRYLAALGTPEAGATAPPRASVILASAGIVTVLVAFGSLRRLVGLSSVSVLAQYAVSTAALAGLAALPKHRRHGMTLRDLWPAPFAMTVVVLLLAHAGLEDIAIAAALSVAGAAVARGMAKSRARA